MSASHSPLRYPGGKQALAGVISRLMNLNGSSGGTYVEPYAGGAGAALDLLYSEHARVIHINDADPRIFAFWSSVLHDTDALIDLIMTTPVTVPEWERQRTIYLNHSENSRLDVGFATFYLNRCNRSGIIGSGGIIGGKAQTGQWKIDARFNRVDLVRRITKISLFNERIELTQLDGIHLLGKLSEKQSFSEMFVYLDPPYFEKGRDLYLNYYRPEDHVRLANFLKGSVAFPWVLSYDNVPEIRSLYSDFRQIDLSLYYSAGGAKVGREILIVPANLLMPSEWKDFIPTEQVTKSRL